MKELVDAIWSLQSRAELQDFLRDLCTLGELEAMSHRWAVARELDRGVPYHEVAARTGASTTTVERRAVAALAVVQPLRDPRHRRRRGAGPDGDPARAV